MVDERLMCIGDFEKIAQGKITENAWRYYSSGADGEQTLSENRNAYDR